MKTCKHKQCSYNTCSYWVKFDRQIVHSLYEMMIWVQLSRPQICLRISSQQLLKERCDENHPISSQLVVANYHHKQDNNATNWYQRNDTDYLYHSETYTQGHIFILGQTGYTVIDKEAGHKEVLDVQGDQYCLNHIPEHEHRVDSLGRD
jgi:hypothetical protein